LRGKAELRRRGGEFKGMRKGEGGGPSGVLGTSDISKSNRSLLGKKKLPKSNVA